MRLSRIRRPSDPPVSPSPHRGPLLSGEALEVRARALAARFTLARHARRGARRFRARFNEHGRVLRQAYRAVAQDVHQGRAIPPAAEWLLDNHYLVEEAIQEVRRDFPRKFYRQLPTLSVAGATIPRTMALAWLYVAHTHSTVSRESVPAFSAR